MTQQALVFDAYGTLFDVHAVIARCEAYWPGQGTALSQAWRSKQLEYSWLRSLMGCYAPFSVITREALAFACEALGLALDEARVGALMATYLDLALYPDAGPALSRLKAEGRKLAILTNGSRDMIAPLVRNRGLEALFDAVLTVDELRLHKPAPQVYGLVEKHLGVPAGATTFVSSNCWDALGAKSFGFTVCWINRAGAPLDRLGARPDRIVRSLQELSA